MLKTEGLTCDLARNGQEALDVVDERLHKECNFEDCS